MICNMVRLMSNGIMDDFSLQELLKMDKNQAKENFNAKAQLMRVILNLECFMVLAVIILRTVEKYIKVNFSKIKFKELVK